MREIKFRAWDKLEKRYGGEAYISVMANGSFSCSDNLIIEQYTGLKDVNRKEIYEGDIIRYYQPYAKRTDRRVVKWDHTLACFGCYIGIDDKWCDESDWLKIEDVEIIGNIHENKELLS